MICDFCCRPDSLVRWGYPVDREKDPTGDDWAACHECHADIEAGRWEEVVERSVQSMEEYPSLSERGKELRRVAMRRLYTQFRAARVGPAMRESWDLGTLHG